MTDEAATPVQRYQVRNGPYITVIYDTIENKQMLVSDVCQMLNDHQAVLAAANEKLYAKTLECLFLENAIDDLEQQLAASHQLPEGPRLLKEEVDEEDIAQVVSRWTGVPVAKLIACTM